jgi:hypothetical protein
MESMINVMTPEERERPELLAESRERKESAEGTMVAYKAAQDIALAKLAHLYSDEWHSPAQSFASGANHTPFPMSSIRCLRRSSDCPEVQQHNMLISQLTKRCFRKDIEFSLSDGNLMEHESCPAHFQPPSDGFILMINMNQSIYEKLQAWVVGGFSPRSSVIQLAFQKITACSHGGYSPSICEDQTGLFMAAVRIWDPSIQIIRALMVVC